MELLRGPSDRVRVLALIYPIERHVGHWASSSPSIDVVRFIMEGEKLEARLALTAKEHQPHALAVIGKSVLEYLDIWDRICAQHPGFLTIPRIYRCQNTALSHRIDSLEPMAAKVRCAELSPWVARAMDPRFSLVLVQTLDDVRLIEEALYPTVVAACPYGYDPYIFDVALPDIEKTTDVGCYFNLKGDSRRIRLVKMASEICARRGWTFRFVSGKYWHDYAHQIRTTRVSLHFSEFGEIPYRMYETMALGSLFVTDPLRYSVERFFEVGGEYLTFAPDLCDLELVLEGVLLNRERWDSIRTAGKRRASKYQWAHIAEEYVAPALRKLLSRQIPARNAGSELTHAQLD